jgi:hypothetical protein
MDESEDEYNNIQPPKHRFIEREDFRAASTSSSISETCDTQYSVTSQTKRHTTTPVTPVTSKRQIMSRSPIAEHHSEQREYQEQLRHTFSAESKVNTTPDLYRFILTTDFDGCACRGLDRHVHIDTNINYHDGGINIYFGFIVHRESFHTLNRAIIIEYLFENDTGKRKKDTAPPIDEPHIKRSFRIYTQEFNETLGKYEINDVDLSSSEPLREYIAWAENKIRNMWSIIYMFGDGSLIVMHDEVPTKQFV